MYRKLVFWVRKWWCIKVQGREWSEVEKIPKDVCAYIHSPLWKSEIVEEGDDYVVVQFTSPDGEISRSRVSKRPIFAE